MPMEEYPTLDDLYWLFETKPVLGDPDLGWPISEATWTTSRGTWTIAVRVGVYEQTVEIECALADAPAIHVKLEGVVDRLSIDRTSGQESLTITPSHAGGLRRVRLTLKPSVFLNLENRLPWHDS
jgi:hypothetical protein